MQEGYHKGEEPFSAILRIKDEVKITWLPKLVVGSAGVFLLIVLFYFGVKFIYEPILIKEQDGLRKEIVKINKSISATDRNAVIGFYGQALNVNDLLKAHTYPSQLLVWIEHMTHARVTFESARIDFEQNKISLGGKALDAQALAEQVAVFEHSPDAVNVIFSNADTSNNAITFQIQFGFKPSLFSELTP